MSTQLSNLMAVNSTSTSPAVRMDGEDFILFLILTTVTLGYLLLDKKRFLILWNKCKSSILELYYYKQLPQSQSSRMSVLALRQWEYRGEGNEYLAIALPEQRKILRLRKSPCPNGFVENIKDWYLQNFNTDLAEEARAAKFEKLNLEYYKILISLIGECYVQPSEDVLLISDEIAKINTIVASKRPGFKKIFSACFKTFITLFPPIFNRIIWLLEYRKKKRLAYSCGSLLTDYAYLPNDWEISQFDGPTFAVEVKPKQGWIPVKERIYHLCTYCLNQYIKLQNGETSGISQYCPMDLFSGQQSRMKIAVKGLLNTPQNNIKIFQEGLLVYGENVDYSYENVLSNIFTMAIEKSVDEFCDLVTTALLKQLYTSNVHKCTSLKSHEITNTLIKNYASFTNKVCNLNRSELPPGCVLDRILNLQELDSWGTKKVAEYLNQQQISYKENIYGHAVSVVNQAKNLNQSLNCAKCFFVERDGNENVDKIIQKYLMSAIAKDCSLMLTFRKIKDSANISIPQEHIIRTENGLYAFDVGVFDLYPKPLTCIYKHVRKRSKFIQMYKNITNGNDGFIQTCNL